MKKLYFLAMILAASVMTVAFSACGKDDDAPTPLTPNEESGTGGQDTPDNPASGTLQLTRTCTTCLGDTKCTTCHGTGIGCKTCKGEGIYCKECDNSGECDWCFGSGDCTSCYGRGGTQCTWCSSKPGYCGKCVGSGRYGTAKCTSCNGSGICSYCRGNYWDKCSSCHGSGKCNYCYGRGTCSACNGYPPACTTCGGDGHCAACTNANGKCAVCAGTGKINLQSLTCTESGGKETVFIQCATAWNVTTDVDWITFSHSSGSGDNTMTVTIAANNTASERKGVITFAYGNSKTTVNVSQTGEDARLSVEPTSVFVNAYGTGESIQISSNTSWTVKAADSWVSYSPSSGNGDATITVSASAYTSGTRYSLLTITDASGEISQEIPVAQAKSREELTLLKSMLEKPLGIVDVDLKTASYTTILNAVKTVYEVRANSSVNSFIVYDFDNSSLKDFTYQGMTLSMFDYHCYRYNAYSKEERTVEYVFKIDKTKPSDEYVNYRNGILQDFKYNLNATLTKADSSGNLEVYKGTDADNNNYSVIVRDAYRIDIYAYY